MSYSIESQSYHSCGFNSDPYYTNNCMCTHITLTVIDITNLTLDNTVTLILSELMVLK